MLTAQTQRPISAPSTRQPPAREVDALRNLATSRFAGLVSESVPEVRGHLQALLGKSAKPADKELLRRAVRALSRHQADLADAVEGHVGRRFDDKLHCPEDAISHTGRFSLDALKLFEQLGMQEDFEMEQCVGRLREHCQVEMPRLTVALRNFLGRSTLAESHNPLFPRVFLRGLLDTLHDFDCDATTRQAIFRSFCVVSPRIISDVYAQALAFLSGDMTTPQGRVRRA